MFKIRPATSALTTRVTRMTPNCSSTLTWREAPGMCVMSARIIAGLGRYFRSMRSTPPCRMIWAIETEREASALLTSAPFLRQLRWRSYSQAAN